MAIPFRSREEADAVLGVLAGWMKENRRELHREKTGSVGLKEPDPYVDFPGYRFKRSRKTGKRGHGPHPGTSSPACADAT